MSGAVWGGTPYVGRDMRHGTVTSVSAGLYASEDIGPGRYLPPRDIPLARSLDPKTHPGSAQIDDQLAGEQPIVTRMPETVVERPQPEPGTAEVPWERNSWQTPGFLLRRDHAGSAQVVPPPSGVRSVADYLGAAVFESGQPSPAAGPVCACGCGKALRETSRHGMKYFNATHRKNASLRRAKAAAEQN